MANGQIPLLQDKKEELSWWDKHVAPRDAATRERTETEIYDRERKKKLDKMMDDRQKALTANAKARVAYDKGDYERAANILGEGYNKYIHDGGTFKEVKDGHMHFSGAMGEEVKPAKITKESIKNYLDEATAALDAKTFITNRVVQEKQREGENKAAWAKPQPMVDDKGKPTGKVLVHQWKDDGTYAPEILTRDEYTKKIMKKGGDFAKGVND